MTAIRLSPRRRAVRRLRLAGCFFLHRYIRAIARTRFCIRLYTLLARHGACSRTRLRRSATGVVGGSLGLLGRVRRSNRAHFLVRRGRATRYRARPFRLQGACVLLGVSARSVGSSVGGRSFRTIATQDRDRSTDGHDRALLGDDLGQGTAAKRFNLDGYLVGFDLGDRLALFDLIAHLFEPADNGSFRHVEAHLGHGNVGHPLLLAQVTGVRLQVSGGFRADPVACNL